MIPLNFEFDVARGTLKVRLQAMKEMVNRDGDAVMQPMTGPHPETMFMPGELPDEMWSHLEALSLGLDKLARARIAGAVADPDKLTRDALQNSLDQIQIQKEREAANSLVVEAMAEAERLKAMTAKARAEHDELMAKIAKMKDT